LEANLSLLTEKNLDRRIIPDKYLILQTDLSAINEILYDASPRFTKSIKKNETIIELPQPDGTFEKFVIFYAELLPKKLQDRFPRIRHYSGYGLTDPLSTIKLDIGPKGIHGFILNPIKGNVFIDPYARGENKHHIIYYAKDFHKRGQSFSCNITEDMELPFKEGKDQLEKAGDCKLRQYDLALACTGEYATYHDDGDNSNGDITEDAMTAMTTSMNRVNGVFERDAGITMIFVDNNDTLIFTNSGTDPYTNSNGSAMLAENQTTCDARIGSGNYDIGHVYSTGGGGVAYLNSPCNSTYKARGVTGRSTPEGDPFDIDYVAHEMGHQYGGKHTQNNSCNRSSDSSYEPGSASTIMGYAGICSPNVQNNSDDYYHAISLSQMGNFTTGSGNSCATILDDTNTKPTIDPVLDYSVPISTPILLTGVATDAEGDPMTYCWEQWDREVATMPPVSTSTNGPAFRSFDPSTSPTRSLPRESVVIGGGTATWEVLPTVSRDLNFRLTVRDNNSSYGCTQHTDMTLTSVASAGPFLVTYPNVEEDWDVDDTKTILWDVANTDIGAVDCDEVDILLSLDGGFTFPVVLASNAANDGSHDIIVPDVQSALVRIRVSCSDNVFYDISDENILINVTETCLTQTSLDVPKTISPNGTPSISSVLDLYVDGDISEVRVIDLEGTHTWVGDLSISIKDPSNSSVLLVDEECGSDDDFDVDFDDSSGALACPYNTNTSYSPALPLAGFNSKNTRGTWTLDINDVADGDGGELTTWGLYVCYIKGNCVASTQIPTAVGVYTGNYECEDDNGWTHYMHITAQNDTLLLLSIEKETTNVDMNASQVKVEVLSGGGAIDLTAAPYVENEDGWFVMKRYWDATPTSQPSGNIKVRSYYSTTDYNDISTSDLNVFGHEDLTHYKITGTDNPDPSTGHTNVMSNEYSEPSYVYSSYGSHHRAEYTIGSFSGGGGGGISALNGVVPVELISFDAVADQRSIKLHWKTTNEVNNRGFEVLRNKEGGQKYDRIGFIPASASLSDVLEYNFVDHDVETGINYYYKLKQIDLNGSFNYSVVRSAKIVSFQNSLKIHPNPSDGLFKLLIEGNEVNEVSIDIININGQLLKTLRNKELGPSGIELNLTSFLPGNYFIKVFSNELSEIRRITKL
jgi:subtilisin-like proprotein convertase family protein